MSVNSLGFVSCGCGVGVDVVMEWLQGGGVKGKEKKKKNISCETKLFLVVLPTEVSREFAKSRQNQNS